MEAKYEFKPFSSFKVGDKVSFEKNFTAKEVEEFSMLTGDMNPIHLDEEFAKKSFFGARLVQGAFVNAVIGGAIAPFCGTASINMGQEWGCPAPTRVGDTVTYEITVKETVEAKHDLMLELKGTRQDGTVVFQGTNRVKIMDKKKGE